MDTQVHFLDEAKRYSLRIIKDLNGGNTEKYIKFMTKFDGTLEKQVDQAIELVSGKDPRVKPLIDQSKAIPAAGLMVNDMIRTSFKSATIKASPSETNQVIADLDKIEKVLSESNPEEAQKVAEAKVQIQQVNGQSVNFLLVALRGVVSVLNKIARFSIQAAVKLYGLLVKTFWAVLNFEIWIPGVDILFDHLVSKGLLFVLNESLLNL